jgi:Ribosomal protein L7/L12 dimerisation domain
MMDDRREDLSDQENRPVDALETLTTEELRQLVAEIEERLGVAN